MPEEFARDFQAGTVYRPVPAEFFARIVAESLKLPARLWRESIEGLLERARLTIYEGTGHCPNWQRPERVAGDLDAFVRDG